MGFIVDFLDAHGLDKLEVIMIKLAHLPKDKGDMNEQLVGEVLKCLRIIMNLDVSPYSHGMLMVDRAQLCV